MLSSRSTCPVLRASLVWPSNEPTSFLAHTTAQLQIRHATTISSIVKGIRATCAAEERPLPSNLGGSSKGNSRLVSLRRRSRSENSFASHLDHRKPRKEVSLSKHSNRSSRSLFAESEEQVDDGLAIPYTTASSEFLYGTRPVIAALKGGRRKFHKLYLQRRAADSQLTAIVENARTKYNFEVVTVGREFSSVLSKISLGRPHNGCLLDASPIPMLPLEQLGKYSKETETFSVKYGELPPEDAQRRQPEASLSYSSNGWRFPFVLLLDGVVDEGNLGGILRTAVFMGVDAVVLSKRSCAPLSPITLKAASGAPEIARLFSIDDPAHFLKRSHRNGWRILTADMPFAEPPIGTFTTDTGFTISPGHLATSTVRRRLPRFPKVPLEAGPCILVMGGEMKGVTPATRWNTERFIGIAPSSFASSVDMDSLNVSVAAGLICRALLSGERFVPVAKGQGGIEADEQGKEGEEELEADRFCLAGSA